MADIPVKNIADLRKKYKRGQTYSLLTAQNLIISNIQLLHKTSEHILIGCRGNCPLRDFILDAVAKAKPSCDYNVYPNKKTPSFYFKSHVGMNLQAFMNAAKKRAFQDKQEQHASFFYLDVKLTHEISIRIFPNGEFDVYNKHKSYNEHIYFSNEQTLFILPSANRQIQHIEDYKESSPHDFFMPLIRL